MGRPADGRPGPTRRHRGLPAATLSFSITPTPRCRPGTKIPASDSGPSTWSKRHAPLVPGRGEAAARQLGREVAEDVAVALVLEAGFEEQDALVRIRAGRDTLEAPVGAVPPDRAHSAEPAQRLREKAESMGGYGVALEALLTWLRARVEVPREVPPTASPQEARSLLLSLEAGLDAAGLTERIEPESLPESVREQAEGPEFFHYEADEALAAWVTALGAMARSEERRHRRPAARPPRRARRKGRRVSN